MATTKQNKTKNRIREGKKKKEGKKGGTEYNYKRYGRREKKSVLSSYLKEERERERESFKEEGKG